MTGRPVNPTEQYPIIPSRAQLGQRVKVDDGTCPPGHDDDKGRELDEATLNRVHMPRGFFEAVSPVLQPGATILVTQSSVGALTTGEHITILDSVVPTI